MHLFLIIPLKKPYSFLLISVLISNEEEPQEIHVMLDDIIDGFVLLQDEDP